MCYVSTNLHTEATILHLARLNESLPKQPLNLLLHSMNLNESPGGGEDFLAAESYMHCASTNLLVEDTF